MKRLSLTPIAGGGLLDRRAFFRRALTYTAAATGAASAWGVRAAKIGEAMPPWMKSPGGPDVGYGSPAPAEQAVQRVLKAGAPQTSGMQAWHTPLAALQGMITPNGLHYTVSHNGMPEIDPNRHELLLHGMLRQPLRFTLDRLLRYPVVSRIRFLECAGNTAFNAASPFVQDHSCQDLFGQASCSEWAGVPLRLLLQEAGVKDGAAWIIAEGADGGSLTRSLPLAAVEKDAIVALYQNGERLRPSQGYPMRLFMPGWEGNLNVKWLHRLEVAKSPAFTKDESGLYTQVLSDGRIERFAFTMEVKSVITHPSGQMLLPEPKGFYEISGLAWSGRGRIVKVEVSADGGKSWAEAQLHEPVLDRAFTRFSIPWHWSGASSLLLSRATDDTGQVQPTRQQWRQRYAAHSFNHYNAIQAWRVNRNGSVENAYA